MTLAKQFASEKEFLISLALQQYNGQFAKNFKVHECDIISIPARPYTDRGYEIKTNRLDDQVVLHMFMTFGSATILSPYRVEVQAPQVNHSNQDERFVTYVAVDKYLLEHGIYKFRALRPTAVGIPVILLETGAAILTETGLYFALEGVV